MNMRIEGDEIAKGLHVEDERWPAAWFHHLETRFHESCNQSTKMPKMLATIAKEWPNQFGEGEHISPMRHRGEDILIKPLAVSEHPFLMTAWAEVSGFAGLGEQEVVSALITADAGESLVQIAAGTEALEHLSFDRSVDETGRNEFIPVSPNTYIQRTCPRVAWAMDTARRRLRVPVHHRSASISSARF